VSTVEAPGNAKRDFVVRGGGVAGALSLALGVSGSAVMIWAFRANPARAFHSYLTAYAFVLTVLLGCLAFVMIGHAANAIWPVAVRRLAEASLVGLPLLAILFVPVVAGAAWLYPWTRPSEYAGPVRRVLEARRSFMSTGFFAGRAAGYLVLWAVLGWLLRRWSLAMERRGQGERFAARLRALSYAGLPLGALTAAFAAFEWLMSLSPEFASTMFGAYFIGMCLLSGTAWLIVLVAFADSRGRAGPIAASHYHALGRLLLAFLIFLGYLAFFQFMLCWIGNKPAEISWYLARSRGVYAGESLFLVVGQLTLPLLALLSYRLKRQRATLAPLAAWCLASQYLHLHWLVTADSRVPGVHWLDLVALAAVGGLVFGFGLLQQRGEAAVAFADPRFAASFRYRSR